MNKEETLKFISNIKPFSILAHSQLKYIIDNISEISVAKGTILTVKGETKTNGLYIIKKGRLYLKTYINKGEVFGGNSILFNAGISLRTATTDEDTVLYRIPEEIFVDICKRFKEFYESFQADFIKNMTDKSIFSNTQKREINHFLSQTEPFSFLPDQEIEDISKKLYMMEYPMDTVLFFQGRLRVGFLYILKNGSAEEYFEREKQKTMREINAEGDIYGGMALLLNDGIALLTLEVKERSVFYLLPCEIFFDICSRYKIFNEYFTNTFGKRMLKKSYASILSKTLQPEAENLQFLNQQVNSLYTKNPIFGHTSMEIHKAAKIMNEKNISSLFINTLQGDCAGVLTDQDLTRKVVSTGYDTKKPVSDIMSSPVLSISKEALIFEALMTMMEKDLHHLGVRDNNDRIVGMLSSGDLLAAQGRSPLFFFREIAKAKSMSEIIDKHNELPILIRSLINNGAKAKNLTRFITSVSDAILNKLMDFVVAELGSPPAKFVFMILGSEGRREQTLKTDQDNAIIYEDVPKGSEKTVRDYFLRFGDRACALLDKAGYDFCKGEIMAKNPKWCQSLSVWKKYFSDWIYTAEAEDLLQASIFFDFRHGWGDMEIIKSLREHLFNSLGGWSGFFRHLTENALHFKPPLGFFRNFVVESKGKNRDAFDIKKAMTPIVDFARIYGLKNKIDETNTLERLHQLHLKNVLSTREYDELEKAYSFLLQLRFVRQVTVVIDEDTKPDNYIKPKKLTRIEQKMLKEIFIIIEKFQTKINFEFIGIA